MYFSQKKQTIDNIVKLERILFLMQFDSLKEYEEPLLLYKTYYNDSGDIYLPLLSDLLRVAPTHNGTDLFYFARWKLERFHYDERLKLYMKMSDDLIVKEIKNILDNNQLNKHYFVKGENSHQKLYRKQARRIVHKGYVVSFFLKRLSVCFMICLALYHLLFYFHKNNIALGLPIEELNKIIFLTLPFLVIYFVRIRFIGNQSTEFEKELETCNKRK